MKKNVTWAIVLALHIIFISIFLLSDGTSKKKVTDSSGSSHSKLEANGGNDSGNPESSTGGAGGDRDSEGTAGGQDSDLDFTIYTVKKGDMGGAIGRKHDISWANIKKFNNLSSDNLKVGQKLKIPKLQ